MALELTEREIAIARGDDPDAAETEVEAVVDEEPVAATEDGDASAEAEEVSGTEAAVEESATEEATRGGTEAADSWIDDDVRTLGQSYGLEEKDLAAFSSADEFRRAAVLLDRNLAKAPVAPTKPAGETAPPEAATEEPDLDPEKYRANGYDDDTVNLVVYAKKLKEQLGQLVPQVEEIRQAHAQAETVRRINAFHDAVDNLDEGRFGRSSDEYGRPVEVKGAQNENRRKLFEAAETLKAGIVARAQAEGKAPELPPYSVLLKRAENLVFAEELAKVETAKVRKQVAAQSKKRRPVAGNKPTRPAAGQNTAGAGNPVSELVDNPEIVKLWNQMQEANGAD